MFRVYKSVGHFFTLIAIIQYPDWQINSRLLWFHPQWVNLEPSQFQYILCMDVQLMDIEVWMCLSVMWEHLIECNPRKIYSPDQLTCDFRLIRFQLLLKSIQPSSLSILLLSIPRLFPATAQIWVSYQSVLHLSQSVITQVFLVSVGMSKD